MTLENTIGNLSDSDWMEQALQLAACAKSAPNPRVGCVLVSPTGQLLGAGFTQEVGGPHAEVMALRAAQERGHITLGATAYVTLEPCFHHGRTGPCCDALIAAGISKVVASLEDPNPLVTGRGIRKLRASGIDVLVGPGAESSRELNLGFLSRMICGTPWVRMKIAASIDGKTALQDGTSKWITSEAARLDGHAWRARAGVILTGIGTIIHDNPSLNVRMENVARQPDLAIVDGRLGTPPNARLFVAGRAVYIYTASQDKNLKSALEDRGATVIYCPDQSGTIDARVDLKFALEDLAEREFNEVHVEAGSRLNGALLKAGLVNELLIYLAPKWLGPGRGMADSHPLKALEDAIPLHFHSVDRVGDDVRFVARTERFKP